MVVKTQGEEFHLGISSCAAATQEQQQLVIVVIPGYKCWSSFSPQTPKGRRGERKETAAIVLAKKGFEIGSFKMPPPPKKGH